MQQWAIKRDESEDLNVNLISEVLSLKENVNETGSWGQQEEGQLTETTKAKKGKKRGKKTSDDTHALKRVKTSDDTWASKQGKKGPLGNVSNAPALITDNDEDDGVSLLNMLPSTSNEFVPNINLSLQWHLLNSPQWRASPFVNDTLSSHCDVNEVIVWEEHEGPDPGDGMSENGSPPFPLIALDMHLLDQTPWSKWMKNLMENLEEHDLGPQWKNVLGCLTVWEGRATFKELKGGGFCLSSAGWPAKVEAWIKNCYQKGTDIPKEVVHEFANTWWSWWKLLQLRWQTVEDVEGLLVVVHHREYGHDWSLLQKTGQNGFTLLVACLAWWGQAVASRDSAEQVTLWDEWWDAVEEVHFVLIGLLAYVASAL